MRTPSTLPPTGASCSASPTIARTRRSRPAISTTSCSWRCCAPQHSRRCATAGPRGLREDEFGQPRAGSAWASPRPNASAERNGCSIPRPRGSAQVEAERTLARVLAHRVWVDQRRGWRFTNPNLEELGLVRADYVSLDELAADDGAFANAPPELRTPTRDTTQERSLDTARSPAPWPGDHGRRPGSGNVDVDRERFAAEPARTWSISQQEDPRGRGRADHRCAEDAPRPACAASR